MQPSKLFSDIILPFMKLTKSFIKLWVAQMLANPALLQDSRVTGDLVGDASRGDLPGLRKLLAIYQDHIDTPRMPTYFNTAPDAPDNRMREVFGPLPVSERRISIQELIAMIDEGSLSIE